MKAEFFCLTGDERRAALLQKLISTYVDPSIPLTVYDIASSYQRYGLASRYQQLMQASIPPALGLSLAVTTLDWFQDRVYVTMYWPILSEGYWTKIGGSSVYYESYETTRKLEFWGNGRGLELFFPALAISDRMVLMPSGQSKLLERVKPEHAKAVDVKYDVLEVDFDDDTALDNAIRLVAQKLMQEIRQNVREYSSRFNRGVFNASQAAVDLQLSPALLTRAFQEESNAIADIYQQLSSDLGQKTFLQGRWTKTALVVRNESDREFREVMVKIAGPVELLPRNIKVNLPAHSTVPVEVSIRPADPGDFPLEIVIVLREDQALVDWLPVQYIWVQSMTQ